MKIKVLFFLIALTSIHVMQAKENKDFEKEVRAAVERQLFVYPASTLKDIYKNFFQDKFGPGHLINDTTAAGNYIRREMASYSVLEGEIAEPTGWEGNFYRVNLSVIKSGQISYEVFFDAFIRSVNGINPPAVSDWKKEWEQIEAVVANMHLSLPDYEKDKNEIIIRLENGEYVGHHSELFEANYSPHYRIISRDIYEQELLPLLN